jgi:hypothetical protein
MQARSSFLIASTDELNICRLYPRHDFNAGSFEPFTRFADAVTWDQFFDSALVISVTR